MGNKPAEIRNAEFLVSSPDINVCPPGIHPEYAFIGRSNVGKSSLINMITGIKGLAKTSQTPGKTQLINHFVVNEEWYLVDLPGYGYAKISRQERNKWMKMIYTYLEKRENLVCTFILVDSRHEPQALDMDFMAWMSRKQLPFVIVFTKSDKLSKTKLAESLGLYKEKLLESWEELPLNVVTSANTGTGKEDILSFIEENNRHYKKYLDSLR